MVYDQMHFDGFFLLFEMDPSIYWAIDGSTQSVESIDLDSASKIERRVRV